VSLRAADAEDACVVAEVYLASRKVHLPYAPLAHTDDQVRHWIHEVLIPDGGVTVAVAGRTVIGMMATSIDEDGCGWVDQLYLAPRQVSRGVGSALLAVGLARLPRPVRLYTFQQNVAARRFYERHHFVPIAFTDGSGNEEGCPDVLYELGPAAI
jgi:GNAT superfamily N-acetyltransferase